ncbi:MAG TPA: putative toxin-antitoxin system toxin component, PIN family [Bacteroidia bacterium]|nr:putative toxin-antitoxin system toxin component, PIN family [Bacteroidia bacterium]
MQRKNKLVIDTNLWISWLIGKRQTQLSKLLADESVEIFTSAEQIHELFEVIERSKFRKHFPTEISDEFKLFFIEALNIIDVKIKVKVSRNSKDDFLIALAKTAKANYLLTGDKDLLVLKKHENTKIYTLEEYFNR